MLTLELGTPEATRVQDSIQQVLVSHDLATQDDQVMAEYVTVMIANRKGPSMIEEELRDLMGGELDASIAHKIWAQACEVLGVNTPAAPAAPLRARSASPPPPSRPDADRTQTSREDRWADTQQVSPIRGRARRQERERFPAGGRRKKEAASQREDAPSLLARAGVPDPRAAPFTPNDGMPPMPMPMPPPFAMAMMASMAGQEGPSLFARLDPMMPNNPSVPPVTMAPPPRNDPSTFPTKPTQSALCRWSLQCTNPMCPYSHPSPANAGRHGDASALVLREEACEKGGACTDKDCVLSHVSPAVAFATARHETTAQATPCRFQQQCLNPSCTYAHYDANGTLVPPPGQSMPSSSTPCRYGAACTRADCMFSHPSARPRSSVPCRYGDGCTRPDCYFTHPRDGPAKPTSERLQAFAEDVPDRERIIPGEMPTPSTTQVVP